MKREELSGFGSPGSITRSVVQNKPAAAHTHRQPGGVREASYKGHRIVIRTTYRILVDGKPVDGHLGVTNDGRVHYHAVPNMSFASAVDLVKQVIDTFPDDFPANGAPQQPSQGGGHNH